jgi:hypothetical protein
LVRGKFAQVDLIEPMFRGLAAPNLGWPNNFLNLGNGGIRGSRGVHLLIVAYKLNTARICAPINESVASIVWMHIPQIAQLKQCRQLVM